LTYIRDTDHRLPGYNRITQLVGDFEHEGPNGKQMHPVFQIYSETLRNFGTGVCQDRIPIKRDVALEDSAAIGLRLCK
jgi:hypothetical protein